MQRIASEKKTAAAGTIPLDLQALAQVAPARPLEHPYAQLAIEPANEPALSSTSGHEDKFDGADSAQKKLIEPKFSARQMLLAVFVAATTGASLSWLLLPTHTNPPPALAAFQPAKPEPALAASTARTVPATPADRHTQAGAQLERWRQAWQDKDIETYLQSYSKAFTPPGGQLRPQWEAARRKNFAKHAPIQLRLSEIRMEDFSADSIKIYFLQDYASGSYRERARPKEILMQGSGSHWEIIQERQYPQGTHTKPKK